MSYLVVGGQGTDPIQEVIGATKKAGGVSFLSLCYNYPQTRWLPKTHVYYLPIGVGLGSGPGLAGSPAQGPLPRRSRGDGRAVGVSGSSWPRASSGSLSGCWKIWFLLSCWAEGFSSALAVSGVVPLPGRELWERSRFRGDKSRVMFWSREMRHPSVGVEWLLNGPVQSSGGSQIRGADFHGQQLWATT